MENMEYQDDFFSSFVRKTEIREWGRIFSPNEHRPNFKTYPRFPRHHLPDPALPSQFCLPDAFLGRHSALELISEDFSALEVSTLLAAVGARPDLSYPASGRRMYPSAGAKYPVETYLIALRCTELPSGLYHYALREHELEELWMEDLHESLLSATDDQRVLSASLVFIFSIVYGRVAEKYGQRGLRYGLIEIGHMAQNISLTACALRKGCCEIGGFVDSAVNKWLDIDGESEAASLLMVLGGESRL